MELKTYKLWKSGMPVVGEHHWSQMPVFMGKMEGISFQDAVGNFIKELPAQSHGLYTELEGKWHFCSTCLICETYEEAVAFRDERIANL